METDEGGEECLIQMEEGSQESVHSILDMSGVEEEGGTISQEMMDASPENMFKVPTNIIRERPLLMNISKAVIIKKR